METIGDRPYANEIKEIINSGVAVPNYKMHVDESLNIMRNVGEGLPKGRKTMIPLFTFGSLQPGCYYFNQFNANSIKGYVVSAKLRDYALYTTARDSKIPFIIPSEGDSVWGVLMFINYEGDGDNDRYLKRMDRFEGSSYNRTNVQVWSKYGNYNAWTYVFNPGGSFGALGKKIKNGDFFKIARQDFVRSVTGRRSI